VRKQRREERPHVANDNSAAEIGAELIDDATPVDGVNLADLADAARPLVPVPA
jgi:hypothetical protein